MRANRDEPLAARIRDKLEHQGLLTSAELNPFIGLAVEEAVLREGGPRGILIDGFPRCEEQLGSWVRWPFQERLPLVRFEARQWTTVVDSDLTQTLTAGGRREARRRALARGDEGERGGEVPRPGARQRRQRGQVWEAVC